MPGYLCVQEWRKMNCSSKGPRLCVGSSPCPHVPVAAQSAWCVHGQRQFLAGGSQPGQPVSAVPALHREQTQVLMQLEVSKGGSSKEGRWLSACLLLQVGIHTFPKPKKFLQMT